MLENDLNKLFSNYWLENQILPQGYFLVNSTSGVLHRRPPRHKSSIPDKPFNWWKACKNPKLYANALYAEGYAELSLIIGSGIVEVYTKKRENDTTSPIISGKNKIKLEFNNTENYNGTPPLFSYLRAYVNDRGIWQTKVASLSNYEYQTIGGNKPNINTKEYEMFENVVNKSGSIGSDELYMQHLKKCESLYKLDYCEEVKIAIYSPASVLSLHFLEKDFCKDATLADTLISSITVPIYLFEPGKTYDILLSTKLEMPSTYSLESIINASNSGVLEVQPEVVIIIKLVISITLSVAEPNALSELAALTLHKSIWTAQTLINPEIIDSELLSITACDIYSVYATKGPVTIAFIARSVFCLCEILYNGFDETDSEQFMISLKKHVSFKDIQRNILENIFHILIYLFIGPIEKLILMKDYFVTHNEDSLTNARFNKDNNVPYSNIYSNSDKENRQYKSYLGDLIKVLCINVKKSSAIIIMLTLIWSPLYFYRYETYKFICKSMIYIAIYYAIFELELPVKPSKKREEIVKFLITRVGVLNALEGFIQPIIDGLDSVTQRKIRIIDIWLQFLASKCTTAAKKRDNNNSIFFKLNNDSDIQTQKKYMQSSNMSTNIFSLVITLVKNFKLRFILIPLIIHFIPYLKVIIALIPPLYLSLYLLQNIAVINGIRVFLFGISRYIELMKLRNRYTIIEKN